MITPLRIAVAVIVLTLAFIGLRRHAGQEASAQIAIGGGAVARQYETLCASCHDSGGNGGDLFDAVWRHGGDPEEIARAIKYGIVDAGMPAFDTLSDDEIRALVIYMSERAYLADGRQGARSGDDPEGAYTSDLHPFMVRTLLDLDGLVWSIKTFPETPMRLLLTMRDGRLIVREPDGATRTFPGPDNVRVFGQGGLMDAAFHPNYSENGWVYLCFSDQGERNRGTSLTKVVRGRIAGNGWVDQETIFEADQDFYTSAGIHFGCRLTFDDAGYLYFSIGERGQGEFAQDLSRPNGKIYRVFDDGRVPPDNPFVGQDNVLPAIYSKGHRNPQGLIWDPQRGALLELEHGPRGGDEFNLIRPGRNYGWPLITYGMNYSGTPITAETSRPGLEQPITYWTPSLAVSSVAPYYGEAFPNWRGDILVASLAAQEMRRLRLENEVVVTQEVLIKNRGRIRDIHVDRAGRIFAALSYDASGDKDGRSRVVVIEPSD